MTWSSSFDDFSFLKLQLVILSVFSTSGRDWRPITLNSVSVGTYFQFAIEATAGTKCMYVDRREKPENLGERLIMRSLSSLLEDQSQHSTPY